MSDESKRMSPEWFGILLMMLVVFPGVVGVIATAMTSKCSCEPTLAPPPPGVTAEEWSKSP